MKTVSRFVGRRRRRLLAVAATGTLLFGACGDVEERSLCNSYEQFLVSQEVLRSVDAESETAAEAIEDIEEFQASLAQLRENADDRYRSAVDDLDAAVSNVLRTLEGVDPDEDYSTWAPLVVKDVKAAREAAAYVSELIAPQCASTEGN